MASRFISPVFQAIDSKGKALPGAQLFFYEVGSSTTLKDTFSDEALTTKNSNPVLADGAGIFPNIYGNGSYRVTLNSSVKSKSVQQWARDNVEFIDIEDQTNVVFNYDTLNDAVISTTLADGQALDIKERTTGNGGGAMWDVVLSTTVTENTFNIVQATGVATLSLVLRVGGTAFASQFGAVENLTDNDAAAIQAAIDFGARTVSINNSRIITQLLVDTGQTISIDGDLFVDIPTVLGSSATVADVMQASAFANRRGLATTLAFIGTGTIITAITASGNFLPNQNHNATDNGEIGIHITQTAGRIYSERSRYTPDTGPYAVCCFAITESTHVSINNVENMGAGIFSYHTLNGHYEIQCKDVGTDFRSGVATTDLLGGSYGCVYLGKALNYDNYIVAQGENCNDVLTLDGICRTNTGSVTSFLDTTDAGAENNRVYELSDNCRGNSFEVVANGGGNFEHLVYQDACDENYARISSFGSQGRGMNLRRNCKGNTVDLICREWDGAALSLGAIELLQGNSSAGCQDNTINATFKHSTAGKTALKETLTNTGFPNLRNNYTVRKENTGNLVYTFSDSEGDITNGSLLLPAAAESYSFSGESADAVDAVTQTINQSGITSLSSIRPQSDCQIRNLRVFAIGSFTGTIDVTLEIFVSPSWIVIDTITLQTGSQDQVKEYRDRFETWVDVVLQSARIRILPVSFVGTGVKVVYNLSASETITE